MNYEEKILEMVDYSDNGSDWMFSNHMVTPVAGR